MSENLGKMSVKVQVKPAVSKLHATTRKLFNETDATEKRRTSPRKNNKCDKNNAGKVKTVTKSLFGASSKPDLKE